MIWYNKFIGELGIRLYLYSNLQMLRLEFVSRATKALEAKLCKVRIQVRPAAIYRRPIYYKDAINIYRKKKIPSAPLWSTNFL